MRENIKDILVFLDPITRAITGIVTATVAVKAYKMGRAYFNKGQSNIIAIEQFKRSMDSINAIKAALSEQTRIIDDLLHQRGDAESLLQANANLFNEVDEFTKKALFVRGMVEIRTMYLTWYDTFFVDSEPLLTDLLQAESKLKKDLGSDLRRRLTSDLEQLAQKLDKIQMDHLPEIKL